MHDYWFLLSCHVPRSLLRLRKISRIYHQHFLNLTWTWIQTCREQPLCGSGPIACAFIKIFVCRYKYPGTVLFFRYRHISFSSRKPLWIPGYWCTWRGRFSTDNQGNRNFEKNGVPAGYLGIRGTAVGLVVGISSSGRMRPTLRRFWKDSELALSFTWIITKILKSSS